jgi:hypothetical protein
LTACRFSRTIGTADNIYFFVHSFTFFVHGVISFHHYYTIFFEILARHPRPSTSSTQFLITQLKTILLLNHLNGLNAVWEEQVVFKRILELEDEYAKTQEFQELSAQQQQLFNQL